MESTRTAAEGFQPRESAVLEAGEDEPAVLACARAVGLARAKELTVFLKLRGVSLRVDPWSNAGYLVWKYCRDLEMRSLGIFIGEGGEDTVELARIDHELREIWLGRLIRRLPAAVKGDEELLGWLVEFVHLAERIDAKYDAEGVAVALEAAGYVASAHAGQPPEWFTTRGRWREYAAGQVIGTLRKGLAPHRMLVGLMAKGLKLEGETPGKCEVASDQCEVKQPENLTANGREGARMETA